MCAPSLIDRRALERVLGRHDIEVVASVVSVADLLDLLARHEQIDVVIATNTLVELPALSIFQVLVTCRMDGLDTPFLILDLVSSPRGGDGRTNGSVPFERSVPNVTIISGIPRVQKLVDAVSALVNARRARVPLLQEAHVAALRS